MKEATLQGAVVALFQTRHADAFENLVRKHGGEPLSAPTMLEVPNPPGPELDDFVASLRGGFVDVFVVLTGVGQRALTKLLADRLSPEAFGEALGRALVAARGPKSVAALREIGVRAGVVAPEPHTTDLLLEALRDATSLEGKRVVVQRYGVPQTRFERGLEEAGAVVTPLDVYRWSLPVDTQPIERSIRALIAGEVQVALFTSAPQAAHLFALAHQLGCEAALREALQRIWIGSVGPSCSEGLREVGLVPDFEPEHPKMGQLVLAAAAHLARAGARKH